MTKRATISSDFPAAAVWLISALLVLTPVAARSAEDSGKTEAAAAASTDTGAAVKPAANSTGDASSLPPAKPAADPAFVPSEEISEDLSVPFPVDI